MNKFIPYTFRKNEILKNHSNLKQAENWIAKQLKTGRIKKVRNGLYVVLDHNGYVLSTKFEIATKISRDSFVAYHSALEYYGLANQVSNNVIVGTSNRFNDFEFDGIEYIKKQTANFTDIIFINSAGVRISSLERTVIDCIDNINLAGGIEELLNALEQIKVLNEEKLLNVLNSNNQIFLYQKTGYILEQYKEQLMLSEDFFLKLESYLTHQIKYFLQDEYKNIKFNPKWKLMAPRNLKSRINGGLE